MRRSMSPLWWRDSNQTASGKPGSVQAASVAQFVTAAYMRLNIKNRHGLLMDSRGSAVVRQSGMGIVDRGNERLSTEVGGVQTFDEPVLPLVPGAEGGEEAGERRHLSIFPGTLA